LNDYDPRCRSKSYLECIGDLRKGNENHAHARDHREKRYTDRREGNPFIGGWNVGLVGW
jgi:hypothetical protein